MLQHLLKFLSVIESFDLTRIKIWAQLFKTNKVVTEHTVKTWIIKYGIYANIFAEKM